MKLVRQNDESLLRIREDVTFMERAQQSNTIDAISLEVSIIINELKRVTNVAIKYGDCSRKEQVQNPPTCDESNTALDPLNTDEILRSSMETFVDSASAEIQRISSSLETLKRNYSSLLTYFGEDPNKKSSDFFGTLSKFLSNFEGAVQHVDKEEKAKVSYSSFSLYDGLFLYK